MGGHEERPGPPAEVLLEPLERVEVEVVRRLVEEEQVGIGDDEPRQRRPRLLAAGQRGRRLGPLVAREAEPGQRGVDPLVERVAAERRRTGAAGRRSAGSVDVAVALERGQLGRPSSRGARRPVADGRAQVRRGHERRVEVRLLGEQPDRQPALALDACRGRARRGPAASRSSVVLPAPFGPTRPTRSPSAIGALDGVEDDERADLAGDAARAAGSTSAGRGRVGRDAARLRPDGVAAARFVRSVRLARPRAARLVRRSARRCPPRPPARVQRRPRRTVAAGHRRAGSRRRASGRPPGRRWHHEQKWVERAPMTIALDRPAAAPAGLAGPLVDVEALLHRAVAVGRRVVVDGRAAPLDRLGEDRRGWPRRGGARRRAAACRPTAAGGAAPATAPRRRRCCRRRRGTTGRAAAA